MVQVAREHPAHYVVFDLLADPDRRLLDLPVAHAERVWRRCWSAHRRSWPQLKIRLVFLD